MGYFTLQQCVEDLESAGHLIRLEDEVDACLEAAEIHRRVNAAGGPAVLFARVKNCRFPLVSNLFGTIERARFMFRDTLTAVQQLVQLKVDPRSAWKHPWRAVTTARTAIWTLPRQVKNAPVLAHQVTIDSLPQQKSWPEDGGAFVTLPAVYSENVERPGMASSNLGMYRVQLSGGKYQPNQEVGLHYQIHRGIGVHHAAAMRAGQPFRVNIFIGGAPAIFVAAVMPLPEGMSELGIAGVLAGYRLPMHTGSQSLPIYAQSDFCICGTVEPQRILPEGPFGDHLGYYSLVHDYPVLRVDQVCHRKNAIWPFTVVGRPPQEDSVFGELIHELTGPVIPSVLPGVHAVHAVDAAGVHPLLLAIGSERYVPYEDRTRPRELLSQANAILGQGQLSLAKYLLIVAHEDQPSLNIRRIEDFFRHLLERVDWERDVHFQTSTTIDTLDYSGTGLNEGSKVVIASVGAARRELPTTIPAGLRLPDGFSSPCVCLPGVLAVQGPACPASRELAEQQVTSFCDSYQPNDLINRFSLLVIVDNSDMVGSSLRNFLWVTFTRSNPATDICGIGPFTSHKHWGCRGSLVIDGRSKPHHAPPLVEDPDVSRRVDALAARGGPLAKYL